MMTPEEVAGLFNENILTAAVVIGAIVLGQYLGYRLAKRAEHFRHRIDMRSNATRDYLEAFSRLKLVENKSDSSVYGDALRNLMKAQANALIYGSESSLDYLAQYWELHLNNRRGRKANHKIEASLENKLLAMALFNARMEIYKNTGGTFISTIEKLLSVSTELIEMASEQGIDDEDTPPTRIESLQPTWNITWDSQDLSEKPIGRHQSRDS